MAPQSSTATKKELSFTVDGKELKAYEGETVLEACLRNGVSVPHYCWHPGLGIDGNCRMCLVYTKPGPPKPQISCNTRVSEGMEVDTSSDQVKKDREGVLEFLLINHPLDCPVCDQAGECDLQQYSYDHGRETSNFVDIKVQQPRKDFGPLIRYNGNRCIACTRCVRFCQDVTGTGELAMVNRSDHAAVDIFPGVPLDNPLSGCTADLCPVGALLETDSIHSTRVWLLRGTKSVCGGCATGCNVNVETYNDEVKRVTPRENQPVNRWWMCDSGRVLHRELAAEDRLRTARVQGEPAPAAQAIAAAAEALRSIGEGKLAGLATGLASNEELFLLKTLVGKGPLGAVFRPEGDSFRTKDGFEISPDKNPNREGLRRVLGELEGTGAVREALEAGTVEGLVVLDGVPGGAPWSAELLAAMEKAEQVVVLSFSAGAAAERASVVLPAMHAMEKDGTFVNGRGRLQRVRAAVSPPGDARPDLEVLQELALAAGRVPRVVSAGGVFRRLVSAMPSALGQVSYREVGDSGLPTPGAEDTTPPEECTTYYPAGPVSRSPGRAHDEQTRIPVHRQAPVGYGTTRGND